MIASADRRSLLAGIRVLDLATLWAEMAGRILADLGAEVLKVEPAGGALARSLPPFDERPGHGDESLYWAAVGAGKQSLRLDLDQAGDREIFQSLASSADILVESDTPGVQERRGLGYGNLSAINPALVYVSVTPYGQGGPKAHWPATELTVEAASGRMAYQGDGDRPPLPLGYPQAAFHAGAQAACDAIVALNERDHSGLGQYLDVSAQACMTWTLMDATGYPPLTGMDPPGGGDDRPTNPARPGSTVASPCRDGYVVATVPDHQLAEILPEVLAELHSEGPEAAALADEDWGTWMERALNGALPLEKIAAAKSALESFYHRHTKAELFAWATEHGVRLAPINTTADIIHSPHHAARGFWVEAGEWRHASAPWRLSSGVRFTPTPAPVVDDVRPRLPELLHQPGRSTPVANGDRPGEAFAGLRVADFTWVAAGPLTSKALADHGATVIKIESSTRPDVIRHLPPFLDNIPGPDRSQTFGNVGSSKLSVTLDLSTPTGRILARRLCVEWADVVMDSFTPGTMKRFGLDYESLSAERSDIISLSTCLMGGGGPLSTFGGFGNHGAALAGMTHLTGWPDRPPAGPAGPYTDIVTPRFAVAVLAAAIRDRRKSGRGQAIDISQVECAARFLEPLLLDAALNRHIAGPAGHDSPTACPNGVYAARGVERYVALGTETPRQWRALVALLDVREFDRAEFEDLETRRGIASEIDRHISAWMATRDAFVAEKELCEAGVPAAVVQRATDLHQDPQLAQHRFFVPLDHPEIGRVPYDGFATRFSAREETLRGPAPLLGQHTEYVLRQILQMDGDAIAAAAAEGALS